MINIKNFEEFIEDNEFEGLQKECSTKHFRVIEYFSKDGSSMPYNVPQISDRRLSQKKTITLQRNGKDNTKKVHP